MQGMFLLQIQSPWKQNFSLSMLYLWWSKRLLFGRHFSIFFVDDEYFWNEPLLSPLKSIKFLPCSIQCSPLKQRHHFSIGFWNLRKFKVSLFLQNHLKIRKFTWCVGKNFYKKVLWLAKVAQVSSDVEIAMVTTSIVFSSKKSHKSCADISE